MLLIWPSLSPCTVINPMLLTSVTTCWWQTPSVFRRVSTVRPVTACCWRSTRSALSQSPSRPVRCHKLRAGASWCLIAPERRRTPSSLTWLLVSARDRWELHYNDVTWESWCLKLLPTQLLCSTTHSDSQENFTYLALVNPRVTTVDHSPHKGPVRRKLFPWH